MELPLAYNAELEEVTEIRQITDPPMQMAKGQIDGFYFINYLNDQLKGLFGSGGPI